MARYLLNRAGQGIVVLFGAITISFLLANATGNAIDALGVAKFSPETAERLIREYGFDRPVVERYWNYLGGVVQGDFGLSFRNPRPALDVVLEALPYTLGLVASAIVIATALSVPVALLSVLRRDSRLDVGLRRLFMVLQGVPEFFAALILVLIFAVTLQWLPSFGVTGPTSYVLPVAALTLPLLSTLTRLLRSQLIDILGEDFVTALRAKGLSQRDIAVRHAIRNAMAPLVSYLALQVGWLVGGTLLVEVVFGIPGIGLLAVDATDARDLNVIQAIVVVVAAAYVALNLVADLVVYGLDPRVRTGGA